MRIKVILPLLAATLGVLFIAVPIINDMLEKQLQQTDTTAKKRVQAVLEKSDKTLTLNNIVYEGSADGKNGTTTYKITAEKLSNGTQKNAIITLTKPTGTMTTQNGITTTFIADGGQYDPAQSTLSFTGAVQAKSSGGTVLSSQKIVVNFATNTVHSHGKTMIKRDGTLLRGNGAVITDDNVFKMVGRATLVTTPQ